MKLHLLGLNHKTAPLGIREKAAVTAAGLKKALRFILSRPGVTEALILSTCNRTEIYTTGAFSRDFFRARFRHIDKYLYRRAGRAAALHLLRVASGLDSMMVGEGQILGQIKAAWKAAYEEGATAAILNSLFNCAVACGKRSRSETQINRGAISLGSAAAQLCGKIFGGVALNRVLIVGAGKMGFLTARQLKAGKIFVMNRTFSRAREISSRLEGKAVRFTALRHYLKVCDVAIVGTSASRYLLSKSKIVRVMAQRGGQALFMIDLGVPRNIDPRAREVEGVYVYDVDDLAALAAQNLKERQKEIPKVEKIIREELANFLSWYRKRPKVHCLD